MNTAPLALNRTQVTDLVWRTDRRSVFLVFKRANFAAEPCGGGSHPTKPKIVGRLGETLLFRRPAADTAALQTKGECNDLVSNAMIRPEIGRASCRENA